MSTPRLSNPFRRACPTPSPSPTLHGCPPAEIERIATYLITEKGLNTYIKCNPTLLGYEFARQRLNELGFDYIVFDDTHFREDLQWADAVPMFERLIALCAERGPGVLASSSPTPSPST